MLGDLGLASAGLTFRERPRRSNPVWSGVAETQLTPEKGPRPLLALKSSQGSGCSDTLHQPRAPRTRTGHEPCPGRRTKSQPRAGAQDARPSGSPVRLMRAPGPRATAPGTKRMPVPPCNTRCCCSTEADRRSSGATGALAAVRGPPPPNGAWQGRLTSASPPGSPTTGPRLWSRAAAQTAGSCSSLRRPGGRGEHLPGGPERDAGASGQGRSV